MTETTTASGLRYTDLETGSGETVTGKGQTVIVHYTGWLEDETKFDSSRDRNEPFSFPMECGYVIPGWDEGVKGMQVGGVRRHDLDAVWAGSDMTVQALLVAAVTEIDLQGLQPGEYKIIQD